MSQKKTPDELNCFENFLWLKIKITIGINEIIKLINNLPFYQNYRSYHFHSGILLNNLCFTNISLSVNYNSKGRLKLNITKRISTVNDHEEGQSSHLTDSHKAVVSTLSEY